MELSKRPVLSVEGMSVSFQGMKAVNDVWFALYPGEVTALVGGNGSGKTTLLNAVSGFVQSTGRVLLDGVDIGRTAPWQRARLGIVRTFQVPRHYGRLSNEEDVALAAASRSLATARTLWQRAVATLASLHVLCVPKGGADMPLHGRASLGAWRVLECARIRANRATVALLDEPFCGLTSKDVQVVVKHINELVVSGCAVLLVEHRLELVLQIARSVIQLGRGKVVYNGDAREFKY